MTDKKKIDEAVNLNVTTQQGELSSNTTFNANDLQELAAMLKNAGVAGNSNEFNGPASLNVDVETPNGTMSSSVQAASLRAIMQLLEPDFASVADQEVEPEIVPVEEPAIEPEVAPMDEPVDATIDDEGNLSIAGDDEIADIEIEEAGEEYAGIADRKPVQPDTKMVPARSGDNPLEEGPFDDKRGEFPDTEQGAIDFMKFMSSHDMTNATAQPDPYVNGVWLVSHQGGKSIVYLNDMDFEDIDESAKPKTFADYVREAEERNVEEDVEVEEEITLESLLQEYGRQDRFDSYQRKSRQYGPAFFLNTDCGFASLNDLGTHDYFGHGGVVILAINRGGKWGLNYVAGHDSTKPGTMVTVVTPTSSGQKYREGKVVDSFTMDEYNNDRAGLEARLAQHGITATKKLSVKTFD